MVDKELKDKITYYFICLGAKTSQESIFNLYAIKKFINDTYPEFEIKNTSYSDTEDNSIKEYTVNNHIFKGKDALFEAIEFVYNKLIIKKI